MEGYSQSHVHKFTGRINEQMLTFSSKPTPITYRSYLSYTCILVSYVHIRHTDLNQTPYSKLYHRKTLPYKQKKTFNKCSQNVTVVIKTEQDVSSLTLIWEAALVTGKRQLTECLLKLPSIPPSARLHFGSWWCICSRLWSIQSGLINHLRIRKIRLNVTILNTEGIQETEVADGIIKISEHRKLLHNELN